MDKNPKWYALLIRHQQEKKTVKMLLGKGYQAFVPLTRVEHQWSDRIKQLELPIFPHYIFCRFGYQDQITVLGTASVISVVSTSGRPIEIPDSDIDILQRLSSSGLELQPHDYVQQGELNLIEEGPLAGIQLYIVEKTGVVEFVKSVHTIAQSCTVMLNADSGVSRSLPG